MILYLPLEIPTRELHGYLLLAIHAVSRGHQVLISSSNQLNLYRRLRLVPKGAMIVKNINLSDQSISLYKDYLNDGYDLYALDQEPSILWNEFERFLFDYNITKNQYLPFKAVFCWGQRDTDGFKTFFHEQATKFINTGTPRLDLWSNKYKKLYDLGKKTGDQPYILFVSNFGFLMGERHWTEWIEPGKEHETLQTMQHVENFIDVIDEDQQLLTLFIKSIRLLAKEFKTHKILIRPHPLDSTKKWNNLFKGLENIFITDNSSSLSQWINDAEVVIQNGCTSAIESVVNNTPVITLGKKRLYGDLIIPSKMGLEVPALENLTEGIELCLDKERYKKFQSGSKFFLEPIINIDSVGSSGLIIDTIEELNNDQLEQKNIGLIHLHLLSLTSYIKNFIDFIRQTFWLKNLKNVKYDMHSFDLARDLSELAKINNLNMPTINKISNSGVFLKK